MRTRNHDHLVFLGDASRETVYRESPFCFLHLSLYVEGMSLTTSLRYKDCYAAHAANLRTSDLDTGFFHTAPSGVLAVHFHDQPTVL